MFDPTFFHGTNYEYNYNLQIFVTKIHFDGDYESPDAVSSKDRSSQQDLIFEALTWGLMT